MSAAEKTIVRAIHILLAIILCATTAHGAVHVEKTEYRGWKSCYRITNGEVELIVTGDVGPRIIRYGFVKDQNFFKEYSDQLGKSGEDTFQLRGGDRVWKAPEDPIATWEPDNSPVEVQITSSGVIAREPIEPDTKLQKEIEVSLAPSGSSVTVSHRIISHSLFPLEFSPWALTMMAQGVSWSAAFRHAAIILRISSLRIPSSCGPTPTWLIHA